MVVVDASVIFKWFVEEEPLLVLPAKLLLRRFLSKEENIIIPDILLYELANIFISKAGFTLNNSQKNWNKFDSLKIPIFNPGTNFISLCISFAKKYNVSVYDASYAVLAQQKQCDLITADDKFADKVNLPFIKKLSEYIN